MNTTVKVACGNKTERRRVVNRRLKDRRIDPRRGVPTGPNRGRFDRESRRSALAVGRADVTITAMTYLRASRITVVTKAQLLRALPKAALLLALAGAASAAPLPCHEGPRLYAVDRHAYEQQARRVFAAWGVPFAHRRQYELDHRIPRCLGGADSDQNLWPQPKAEALIKDRLEREACRRVCEARTLTLTDALALFNDWKSSYKFTFGSEPSGGSRSSRGGEGK